MHRSSTLNHQVMDGGMEGSAPLLNIVQTQAAAACLVVSMHCCWYITQHKHSVAVCTVHWAMLQA
jgi:hypothetical protein